MTPEELYRLDVQGYLRLDNVIDPELLRRMNERMDAWEKYLAVRLGFSATQAPPPIPSTPGDDELGAITANKVMIDDIVNLEPVFANLIAHPKIVPYIVETVEKPRLKSAWATLKWKGGFTNPHSNHSPSTACNHYHFNRQIRMNLLVCFYALKDIGPDEGALEVIPGTHKANYDFPGIEQVSGMPITLPMRAGSALLFSHDMFHASFNRTDKVRRTAILTYCPGVIANGYGGDGLYDRMFASAPEGSWKKYFLRRPNGYKEMYPCPKIPPGETSAAPAAQRSTERELAAAM